VKASLGFRFRQVTDGDRARFSSGASSVVCTGARNGAMAPVQILTDPERRRFWSDEQKRVIVAR
jgi:hypothetical protein